MTHRDFKDNVTLALVLGNLFYLIAFVAAIAALAAHGADPAKAGLLLPAIIVFDVVLAAAQSTDRPDR